MTSELENRSSYIGSCHCGAVRYTINLSSPLAEQRLISCNCSICSRNGYVLAYPIESDVTFDSGRELLKGYRFNFKSIEHYFCPTCGTSIGAKSQDPDFFPDRYAINVRTLEDVDVSKLAVTNFDGKNISWKK